MFPTLVGIVAGVFHRPFSLPPQTEGQLALQRVFRARQTVLAGAGDLDVVAGGGVPYPPPLAMAVGDDFGVAAGILVIGRETQMAWSVFRGLGEEVPV